MKPLEHRMQLISAALGEKKASLVLKNAHILNVFTNDFEDGDLAIENGFIVGIGHYQGEEERDLSGKTLVPGFMDGHLHLESAVVSPKEYCRAVLPHGTTAIVADPHEIANVAGIAGIDYILDSTKNLPLDVYLMIPSCVPSTCFDENGCTIGSAHVERYLGEERVLGLAEMMNYPGVLHRDPEVLSKIEAALKAGKIVDGHAPGLSGKALDAYLAAGISSDHECASYEEGLEKLAHGQWVMIREGTACKNLQALAPLCREPLCERLMFVTDDKHPGDLKNEGHIDYIIRKAIQLGVDPKIAYKIASYNPARYFRLTSHGAICPGYAADFVVLDDFETVKVNSVYKSGRLVADSAKGLLIDPEDGSASETLSARISDSVRISEVTAADFEREGRSAKVIGLIPKEILTTDEGDASKIDISNDILKIAVVERHHCSGHIGVAFVKGYGLKAGAVATSIAHDSHNIIVVGANEADMALAVNRIKALKGGMVVVKDGEVCAQLSLPIAGLMSSLSVEEVQAQLDAVKDAAYRLGANRTIDPFMTLSFASLPVIPALRITSLGVVDVTKFELLP